MGFILEGFILDEIDRYCQSDYVQFFAKCFKMFQFLAYAFKAYKNC